MENSTLLLGGWGDIPASDLPMEKQTFCGKKGEPESKAPLPFLLTLLFLPTIAWPGKLGRWVWSSDSPTVKGQMVIRRPGLEGWHTHRHQVANNSEAGPRPELKDSVQRGLRWQQLAHFWSGTKMNRGHVCRSGLKMLLHNSHSQQKCKAGEAGGSLYWETLFSKHRKGSLRMTVEVIVTSQNLHFKARNHGFLLCNCSVISVSLLLCGHHFARSDCCNSVLVSSCLCHQWQHLATLTSVSLFFNCPWVFPRHTILHIMNPKYLSYSFTASRKQSDFTFLLDSCADLTSLLMLCSLVLLFHICICFLWTTQRAPVTRHITKKYS